MKKQFAALAMGAALLGATAVQGVAAESIFTAAATQTQTQAGQAPATAERKPVNFFDPSTWYDGAGHVHSGEMIEFDPANPKDWSKVIDPKTHTKVHMTLTNPRYYAKFMTPGYYMKFMDPNTWMAYMDMANYEKFFKVATSAETTSYWMQPGAYMHAMKPDGYMQMVNPEAYAKMAEDVTKEYTTASTDNVTDMFNPFAWMQKFAEATTVATNTTAAQEKKQQ